MKMYRYICSVDFKFPKYLIIEQECNETLKTFNIEFNQSVIAPFVK